MRKKIVRSNRKKELKSYEHNKLLKKKTQEKKRREKKDSRQIYKENKRIIFSKEDFIL